MLKATFNPILAAIQQKPTTPKLALAPTPPTVRENAPTGRASAMTATPHELPPTSAYVHLPFCRKRCHYCDFPIVALGSSSSNQTLDDPRITNYIQLLCREIKATHSERSRDSPLETVYFGGGTPSLVAPRLVSRVLDLLRSRFGLRQDAEISMEMDPGTFDAAKLKGLMGLGVNRVSLGVQAFQEEMLRKCGRAHGVKDVDEAVEIVGSCGVENWSVDLISSLPHQTLLMWEESLQLTIEARPAHVSVYDLQVEQGTKFGALYQAGEFPLPSETESAHLYRTASEVLAGAGYSHYEISSYCKDGFECKHNNAYWGNRSFLGFGLGSASYVDGLRFSRPKRMKEYANYVEDLEKGLVYHEKGDGDDGKDRAMDVAMLSLRTARGLDLKSFGEAFGDSLVLSLCEAYRPYVESGHVVFMDGRLRAMAPDEFRSLLGSSSGRDRNEALAYVRLSDPHGFLLSNDLISIAFREIAP